MKIAIDAMGGDFAPENIIKGIELARANEDMQDLIFQLFGNEEAIKNSVSDLSQIELVGTSEIIDFHDDPIRVIKQKKNSSMVRAVQSVKEGDAKAVLSAGSTGAFLTAGTLLVGRIKQIDRPGLMNTLPTVDGAGFDILDLGANAENTAKHLEDFAILGSYYAEQVRGVKEPKVGLISNGTEDSKGNPTVKEAHERLSNLTGIHFIGNIEARNLFDHVADVVVVDGFTGNAILKSVEGTASTLLRQISQGIRGGSLKTKIGGALVKKELSGIRDLMSIDKAGGALLAGLKAPVVKVHGNASPEAVYYAIRQIHKMLDTDVVGKLSHHFAEK